MTAIEAIKKIKIALGIEKMEAVAELVDGTQVHVDNEFAVGEQLHVVTEDGSYAPAPEGQHETTEGKLITVDAAGVITAIEEKEEVAAEEVKEEEKVEVKEEMAEEGAEEETKTEVKVEVAPEMVQQVIDAITPLIDQVKELETEMKALKASFSKFSNEPAATPVRNNFKAENAEKKELIDARLDMLAKIRRGK
jgi:hypothetical protein